MVHAIALAVVLQLSTVAGVPSSTLAPAQSEVARLYRGIGVDVEWSRAGSHRGDQPAPGDARPADARVRFAHHALIAVLRVQRQCGGDLSEVLDKISWLIRERFMIQGQVQALTGEGRLSGVVLMALPVVLFCALYVLNQEYVMLLFTEPTGRKMLYGAIMMQLLGALVIRKIINIKI